MIKANFSQSLELGDQMAQSDYYNLDPSLQKSLMLAILRSQREQALSASKFFKLRLTGFATVAFLTDEAKT
jgi:hypothetical protein